LQQPLPLTAYLDDGAPSAAFENPHWPRDLKPPYKRSVGYAHQGSQWAGNRYRCIISTIKEACLRAYRSGLEGVSFQGEVTSRNIPNALNYLAFSHFIHWPEDSLLDFGRKTLGQVLGSKQAGEDYATVLAHTDAGTATDEIKKMADPAQRGFTIGNCALKMLDAEEYQRYRFWEWLGQMGEGSHLPNVGI
jgi:hypothetical protein